ncbi:MAG: hypothetical protein FJ405_06385 [Verrucomicrobia bacterium]|nr:hypothetical protein [Verrucomicrobiota bacterium]
MKHISKLLSSGRALAVVAALLSMACLWNFKASALIREPDNVIYGMISIRGQAITAQDFMITVEARRSLNGPAIAQYQMGELAGAGDFYSLRIPLESLTPTSAASTGTGETVFIVVMDAEDMLDSKTIQIGARGKFTRLDFGSALPDSDNDGLPDAWENAVFGNLDQGRDGDLDRDGTGNFAEYLAGTSPTDPADSLRLTIKSEATGQVVSFRSRPASGIGYLGLQRRYSLEYNTNLVTAMWSGVEGSTNLVADSGEIRHRAAVGTPDRFYRARVWLQALP